MNLRSIAAIATVASSAAGATADTTCALSAPLTGAASTLLVRELAQADEAVILVSGRTLIFDCPRHTGAAGLECYGQSEAPIGAPMQLNVAAESLGPGAVVVVTTRNQFFGKNEHIGYHRRHASVRVYLVEDCDGP